MLWLIRVSQTSYMVHISSISFRLSSFLATSFFGFASFLHPWQHRAMQSSLITHTDSPIVNISIPTSIEHLKAKAPAFKEGGLTITVIASLKLLLYDHDTFSAATLAKMSPQVPADKAAEGNEAVANIHNAIEGGIEFFEGILLG